MVIALMAGLLGLGLLMSMDVFHGTTFRSTRQTLVSVLTLARSRALANDYQSSYGVCYNAPSQLVIFRGTTYVSGNTTNDSIPINPSVPLESSRDDAGALPDNFFSCGTDAIVFSQLAATTTEGFIYVKEADSREFKIQVNKEGTILW